MGIQELNKELKNIFLNEFQRHGMNKEVYLDEKTWFLEPLLKFHYSSFSPYRTENPLLTIYLNEPDKIIHVGLYCRKLADDLTKKYQ
jgi:hypothetical protein